jgi:hypothetical protein
MDIKYFICKSKNEEVSFRKREKILNEYKEELRDKLEVMEIENKM